MKKQFNPKISVIMAVYNGLPYLEEAVASILNQSYKNFEFIIVDDASKDSSWKYLKSIDDKRMILILNRKNIGLAGSLNIAIKKSTGIYVARMDADDISHTNRLEEQIKYLLNNSNVDICGTWADLIDEKGKIIGEKKYPISNNDIKSNLAWYQPIIHPSWLVKKSLYDQLKGYSLNYDMAEDYDFLMRARKTSRMVNIPKKLFKWRLWEKRRSRVEMNKMDKIDLRIKIDSLKRGDFGLFYIFIILQKYIMVYLVPAPLKIILAQKLKLA